MTGAETAQVITAVATLLASVGGMTAAVVAAYVSIVNSRKADVNGLKIDAVHHSTNGMKDELVREVRDSAFARGRIEGVTETEITNKAAVKQPK